MPPHFDVCAADFGCTLSYRIFFGTETSPPVVASVASPQVWDPGVLEPLTTYYWRVDVTAGSASAPGPLWSFTTAETMAVQHSTWGAIKAQARGSNGNEE